MPQLIRRINSDRSSAIPVRKFDRVDALGLLVVVGCACLGAVVTPLQVAQYRWQQTARMEFDARMPPPVVIKPLFDFVGRERIINGVAGGLVSFGIEMILISWSRAVARLVDKRLLGIDRAHAEVTQELRVIRQDLARLSGARQQRRPSPVIDQVPVAARVGPAAAEDDLGPQHLRTSAEACFRLAQGAVSRSLAEELEALGRAFEREAAELEK